MDTWDPIFPSTPSPIPLPRICRILWTVGSFMGTHDGTMDFHGIFCLLIYHQNQFIDPVNIQKLPFSNTIHGTKKYIYRSMNFVDIYGFHVGKHSIFPMDPSWVPWECAWDPTAVDPQVGSTSLLVTGSGTYRATLVLGYAIGKCLEGQIFVFLWMIFGWLSGDIARVSLIVLGRCWSFWVMLSSHVFFGEKIWLN